MKELDYYRGLPYTRGLAPEYNKNGEFVCWVASIEELSGCSVEGKSRLEAMENLDKAFDVYIKGMIHFGEEIPKPDKVPDEQSSIDVPGRIKYKMDYEALDIHDLLKTDPEEDYAVEHTGRGEQSSISKFVVAETGRKFVAT